MLWPACFATICTWCSWRSCADGQSLPFMVHFLATPTPGSRIWPGTGWNYYHWPPKPNLGCFLGGPEMGIRAYGVQLVGITQPVRWSILDILLGEENFPLFRMGMLSTSSPSNFSHEMETTMSLFTFSTIFPSQLVAFIPRSSQLVVFGELYQKAPYLCSRKHSIPTYTHYIRMVIDSFYISTFSS